MFEEPATLLHSHRRETNGPTEALEDQATVKKHPSAIQEWELEKTRKKGEEREKERKDEREKNKTNKQTKKTKNKTKKRDMAR